MSASKINGASRGASNSPPAVQVGGVRVPSPLTQAKLTALDKAAKDNKPYVPVDTYASGKTSPKHATNGHAADSEGFGANNGVKLSAGASPFKPGNGAVTKVPPTPIQVLNRASTADDHPTIVTSPTPADTNGASTKTPESDKTKAPATAQKPIGTRNFDTLDIMPRRARFTTDPCQPQGFMGGHYLKIEGLNKNDVREWETFEADCDWSSKLYDMKSLVVADGKRYTFYCCFDDYRAVEFARDEVDMHQKGWTTTYVSQPEFANAQGGNQKESKWFDGQVIFCADFDSVTQDVNFADAERAIEQMARDFGDVSDFAQELCAWPQLQYRCEFFKISDAKKMLKTATPDNPITVGNLKVFARELHNEKHEVTDVDPDIRAQAAVANNQAVRIAQTPQRNGSPGYTDYASPTGRSAWRRDENGVVQLLKPVKVVPKMGPVPVGVPMNEYVNSPEYRNQRYSAPTPHTPNHLMNGVHMGPRSGSWNGYYQSPYYSHGSPRPRSPIPGPQAVDVNKIRIGQDVRTTIMLRNIPNRMSCHDLKQVLDAYCHGKYDFSYLRIDFEKGTNVGYAFVNFADPMDIIPFVEGYLGKRWQPNNPRCVELSYATVQGLDCLVEKFRNSAIMEEYPDYRPKLWFTDIDAPFPEKIGTQKIFPSPNNMSKRQRSHDNAGQIGLYAPKSGQTSRERGRRSQFDRGTPAQMQEEAYYYNNMSPLQQQQGYGYGHGGYYGHQGYGMAPRMAAPPPHFAPVVYNQGYGMDPYMQGNGYPPQQYGFVDHADPFAPAPYYDLHTNGNGGYTNGNGGYSNGYGTGYANTPASRLRTHSNGKLGGRPGKITTVGGPVQGPDGDYYGSPQNGYYGAMPQVLEADEEAGGYNNTPGPFYCPKI